MPVVQQHQQKLDPRMQAIVDLIIARKTGKTDDVSYQREMKSGQVTAEEFAFAKPIALAAVKPVATKPPAPATEPSPLPTNAAPTHSRLAHDYLMVGDAIAKAIQKLIGGGIAFIPTSSITSYRVHMMRFQASPDANVKSILTDGNFANLQSMVSLPASATIDVRPTKVFGQPGFIDITLPREDEQFITFSADLIRRENHGGKTPQTVLGADLYGEEVRLKEFIHTAVVGESGSGKSNWIQQQVLIQSYWNSPQHMKFAFIDLAKRTFKRFDNYAWLYQPSLLTSEMEDFEQFVGNLREEHDRRTEKFAECGSILAWNKRHPNKPEPIIMIVVEELGRAVAAFGPEAMDAFLVEFAENGRANGMYLTIGMQRPAADAKNGCINPAVLDNMQTLIAFKSGKSTANLIKYPQAQFLRGKGHGRVRLDGEWRDFQSYWMGEDNGDSIIKGLDRWARKEFAPHCYVARKPTIPAVWDEVPEEAEAPPPKPLARSMSGT